jgi:Hsp70 protein
MLKVRIFLAQNTLTHLISNVILFTGARTTPSVVAFAEDGTRHVGDVAKR